MYMNVCVCTYIYTYTFVSSLRYELIRCQLMRYCNTNTVSRTLRIDPASLETIGTDDMNVG